MTNFADRLAEQIKAKGNPCVIGLDPRIERMPGFVVSRAMAAAPDARRRAAISAFHDTILEAISDLVPAVKLQLAFYEQYGIEGMAAFQDTVETARRKGLIVIADAKRSDIASTAAAYANAYLGRSEAFGVSSSVFDVDCITVNPFLGADSLRPFVDCCKQFGKGIFVLVKTSNQGSTDFQDRILADTGTPLCEHVAAMVQEYGSEAMGACGMSSIGAVVGATFPDEARRLRQLMPNAIILVPGFGAQGGTAADAVNCFNADGFGAVVNASRSVTYSSISSTTSLEDFIGTVRSRTLQMISEIREALAERRD